MDGARQRVREFGSQVTLNLRDAQSRAGAVISAATGVLRSNSRNIDSRGGSRAESEDEPIYDSMQEMWADSVYNLPVCKDVPRLARRVVVEDGKGDVIHVPMEVDTASGSVDNFEVVHQLIMVLIGHLEPERNDEIESMLAKIGNGISPSADLEIVMKNIISTLGEDSRVTKVLKTLHQNIVLHCTFALKKHITRELMTKDIRSAKGWQIVITLADFVQVRHTRREQSLDEFGNTENHWEFAWELRMTFDQALDEMTAAQLRVLSLELSDTIDPEVAEKLKKRIVGNLIVM